MTRLILDVDTGIDDALALAYLATFDTVDVLGRDRHVRQCFRRHCGSQYFVCAGTVGASAHSSDTWIVASFMGSVFHSGCRLCEVSRHGRIGRFGPACDSSSSDTAFSDIFSDNSGSDTVFSRDYRSLISVGGYALDDVHANPAVVRLNCRLLRFGFFYSC